MTVDAALSALRDLDYETYASYYRLSSTQQEFLVKLKKLYNERSKGNWDLESFAIVDAWRFKQEVYIKDKETTLPACRVIVKLKYKDGSTEEKKLTLWKWKKKWLIEYRDEEDDTDKTPENDYYREIPPEVAKQYIDRMRNAIQYIL